MKRNVKSKGFQSLLRGIRNNNKRKPDSFFEFSLYPYDDNHVVSCCIRDYKKDPNKELAIVVANMPKIKFVNYKLIEKGAGLWGIVGVKK